MAATTMVYVLERDGIATVSVYKGERLVERRDVPWIELTDAKVSALRLRHQ